MRTLLVALCLTASSAFTAPRHGPTPLVVMRETPEWKGAGAGDARSTKAAFQQVSSEESVPEECLAVLQDSGDADPNKLDACRDIATEEFVSKSAGVMDENSY